MRIFLNQNKGNKKHLKFPHTQERCLTFNQMHIFISLLYSQMKDCLPLHKLKHCPICNIYMTQDNPHMVHSVKRAPVSSSNKLRATI